MGFYNGKSAKNEPKIRDFQNLHIHVKQESVPPMGVLDSSYIKALGVKSAGLKKIFLVFQDTLLHSFTFFGSLQVLQLK